MPEPLDPSLVAEVSAVYGYYAALAPRLDPAHGLGGLLLYAGQLGAETTPLLRAANIAGAASLAVSHVPDDLKQAQRNGVIDFLVTSLDEALRILKNEIRKRQPVSVAISAAPLDIGSQMLARGVQPGLLAATFIEPPAARAAFLERGASLVEPVQAASFHIWPIPAAWNARIPQLDAQLIQLLPDDDAARRWLRLSPRYLGRNARRLRSAACNPETAQQIAALLATSPHSV